MQNKYFTIKQKQEKNYSTIEQKLQEIENYLGKSEHRSQLIERRTGQAAEGQALTAQAKTTRRANPYARLDVFSKVLSYVEKEYVEKVSRGDLVEGAIEGLLNELDPYSAYQEIAMYLAGPLANQQDPPQDIDDETLASMKGFDKLSFRTDSPGKKRRRRAKRKGAMLYGRL